MRDGKGSNLKWVLVPAVITLIVTLARMWGELQGYDQSVFGIEPGGVREPQTKENPTPLPSLFGIFWLMPIFGAYFSFRLLRSGDGPRARGKALLLPLLGFALCAGAGFVITSFTEIGEKLPWFFYGLAGWIFVSWIGAVIASKGWSALFKLCLVYGILARLPVILITVILTPMEKGTHYEKLARFAPDVDTTARTVWLCVAQAGLWIPFTIFFGMIFGALMAFVVPRAKR